MQCNCEHRNLDSREHTGLCINTPSASHGIQPLVTDTSQVPVSVPTWLELILSNPWEQTRYLRNAKVPNMNQSMPGYLGLWGEMHEAYIPKWKPLFMYVAFLKRNNLRNHSLLLKRWTNTKQSTLTNLLHSPHDRFLRCLWGGFESKLNLCLAKEYGPYYWMPWRELG